MKKNKWIMIVMTVVLIAGLTIIFIKSGKTRPPEQSPTQVTELSIQELKIGKGPVAEAGEDVTIHYTGWLVSGGTKFDSSVDRKLPFTFKLGIGQVIKGLDQGVLGMKVGSKRKIKIPSASAYGSKGIGNVVPPNADLVFEVELLKVNKP
jgi:FKBP-type peptidyl-prolyl cis-trans isomerase FkpA